MSIAFLLQGRLCPNLFTEHSCSSLALQNLCPSLLLEEKCSILRGLLAGDLGLWILISGLAIHSGATGQILPYLLPQSGNEQRDLQPLMGQKQQVALMRMGTQSAELLPLPESFLLSSLTPTTDGRGWRAGISLPAQAPGVSVSSTALFEPCAPIPESKHQRIPSSGSILTRCVATAPL